jgi:hypothetical protein
VADTAMSGGMGSAGETGYTAPRLRELPLVLPDGQPKLICTPEELALLAARLDADWGPMLHLGAVRLRWGDCAGLRVGRLDFSNRTLSVAEQLARARHDVIVSGPASKAPPGRGGVVRPARLGGRPPGFCLNRHGWNRVRLLGWIGSEAVASRMGARCAAHGGHR